MKKIARISVCVCVLVMLIGIAHRVSADGQPWSLFGPAYFTATDGVNQAEGADLYTNPQYEEVHLLIYNNINEICVLQNGAETIYPPQSNVQLQAISLNEAFRVIDFRFWFRLPKEDGAYNLCWERKTYYLPVIIN